MKKKKNGIKNFFKCDGWKKGKMDCKKKKKKEGFLNVKKENYKEKNESDTFFFSKMEKAMMIKERKISQKCNAAILNIMKKNEWKKEKE